MHRTRHGGSRGPMAAPAAPPAPTPSSSLTSASPKYQECHICLEDLRQELTACPCGHVYHEACIQQALQINPQCPICRRYAVEGQLVGLYFDVPGGLNGTDDDGGAGDLEAHGVPRQQGGGDVRPHGEIDDISKVALLNDRVAQLMDRVQWQKKQHDLLLAEMKRHRQQNESLLMDKQTLLQRVASLTSAKTDLLSKVAKYQAELSRQAEASRQMSVNQSILNYLNTCDGDAMEEEIQNPRELIGALKKACKFRHDQYQKVVKDKSRLKAMVEAMRKQQQQQQQQQTSHLPAQQPHGFHPVSNRVIVGASIENRTGKRKLRKSAESSNRHKHHATSEYGSSHPSEMKKRKLSASLAPSPSYPGEGVMAPRVEAVSFRGADGISGGGSTGAYTDVPVRRVGGGGTASSRGVNGALGFSRSSYNPNQYGAYNLTPSTGVPVPVSNHDSSIVRRGYDETGKLTNYFIPRETKQTNSSGNKQMPSMRHLLALSNHTDPSTEVQTGPEDMRSSRSDRREYALTNWLHKT